MVGNINCSKFRTAWAWFLTLRSKKKTALKTVIGCKGGAAFWFSDKGFTVEDFGPNVMPNNDVHMGPPTVQ